MAPRDCGSFKMEPLELNVSDAAAKSIRNFLKSPEVERHMLRRLKLGHVCEAH